MTLKNQSPFNCGELRYIKICVLGGPNRTRSQTVRLALPDHGVKYSNGYLRWLRGKLQQLMPIDDRVSLVHLAKLLDRPSDFRRHIATRALRSGAKATVTGPVEVIRPECDLEASVEEAQRFLEDYATNR